MSYRYASVDVQIDEFDPRDILAEAADILKGASTAEPLRERYAEEIAKLGWALAACGTAPETEPLSTAAMIATTDDLKALVEKGGYHWATA